MTEPAQKILVRKYIDWNVVKERLSRYKAIGQHYLLQDLQECAEKPPYYCHYLALMLGTWKDDDWFLFYNDLLECGSYLANWDIKIRYENPLTRVKNEDFFSFLWELQVAKFFSGIKECSVEWTKSGPDLKITGNGRTFYVECYVYTKSFALELFIRELFTCIHPNIKVLHTPYIKFSLPRNEKIESFLNDMFNPFLDESFIHAKLREAENEYPLLLPTPQGIDNFYIYIEGDNSDKYIPGRVPNATGIPENYLAICFKEAIGNKKEANKLSKINDKKILAVNYLLSIDFQMAANQQDELNNEGLSEPIPSCDFTDTINGIFFSACGINKIPSLDNSYLVIKNSINHPILSLGKEFNSLANKGNRFLCH